MTDRRCATNCQCDPPADTICVNGRIYNQQHRIARTNCDCRCHQKKGDVI